MKYDYDFFVIGGGSGGVRSARWASRLGAKTALCEKSRLGGTCVIRGCVPKKLMLYGSSFKKDFETAKAYGWRFKESPLLNWEAFNESRHREIKRLEGIYRSILKNHGVDFFSGAGRLKGPHTVEIQGKTHTARYILIAVGGKPHRLDIPGADLCLSSNDMFDLKSCPKSLLVLGAGYIGLEFANIFQSLGVDVSLMLRKDLVLSGFDRDLRSHLQESLTLNGVKILPKRNPVRIEKKAGEVFVTDDKGGVWSGEAVLMATGRRANTESLNLQALGVKTKNSLIEVDKRFQSSLPGVFAVGDCANTPFQLTPVALNEGMFVAECLFSGKGNAGLSYEAVPSVVFTRPEAGSVGLSEEGALARGFQIAVYESCFRPLKMTLTNSRQKDYMKLIVCKKTDRVLGCHIVANSAGEILQGFAVAVKNRLKKADLDQTTGIHPSSAEELVGMRDPRP